MVSNVIGMDQATGPIVPRNFDPINVSVVLKAMAVTIIVVTTVAPTVIATMVVVVGLGSKDLQQLALVRLHPID